MSCLHYVSLMLKISNYEECLSRRFVTKLQNKHYVRTYVPRAVVSVVVVTQLTYDTSSNPTDAHCPKRHLPALIFHICRNRN